MSRIKKTSGVYAISNTINNNSYVGSSIDMGKRHSQHIRHLRNNTHINKHLQHAWNKYGEDNFTFTIIEDCACIKEILLEKEQYYLDTLKPVYNICITAGSNFGMVASDETKRKISESHADVTGENNPMFGTVHTEETKHLMREIKLGNQYKKGTKLTEESKALISTNSKMKGRFGIDHPKSKMYKIYNDTTILIMCGTEIVKWCMDHSINPSVLRKTLKSNRPLRRGNGIGWIMEYQENIR